MNSPRLVTHAGLTINLSQVKCFRLNSFTDIGKKNTLVVEFKTRYDYIQYPETNEFEKQEYNEQTEIEFPDYDTAKAYSDEWIEIWQEYLDEQT
ncbi:hypothetical protein pgond44_02478 [Psychroflexus gondwanensis ACAM 44]|jgi:hypothetical protein|uniref:Uncharacterized protein n=1 Tax=Psychroflexus gondwanensis ACAM 44 TaxID=1189619 RepID=N1X1Z3_9FLAO|nr:hypothetical protein [Psychroflexus gondwanensis]EMY82068.1 hypothetical protein pgond44_02478 [Psychroflexus gondwanensis ACAM 44]